MIPPGRIFRAGFLFGEGDRDAEVSLKLCAGCMSPARFAAPLIACGLYYQ
jgi:hypothetical protein